MAKTFYVKVKFTRKGISKESVKKIEKIMKKEKEGYTIIFNHPKKKMK